MKTNNSKRVWLWTLGVIFTIASKAAVASAATYFVDFDSGNDANDGLSRTTSWRNVPGTRNLSSSGWVSGNTGWRALLPGDTIAIKSGTTHDSGKGGRILIDSSWYGNGTASNPITIKRDSTWGSGQIVINGLGMTVPNWQALLDIQGRDYIVIDGALDGGIKLQNSAYYGLQTSGNYNTIRYIEAYNSVWANILATSANYPTSYILGTKIDHVIAHKTNANDDWAANIYLNYADGAVVTHAIAYDSNLGSDGIHLGSCKNSWVLDCTVYGNGEQGVDISKDGDHKNRDDAYDVTVRNCVGHDNYKQNFDVNSGARRTYFINDAAWNVTETETGDGNFQVYEGGDRSFFINCTSVKSRDMGFGVGWWGAYYNLAAGSYNQYIINSVSSGDGGKSAVVESDYSGRSYAVKYFNSNFNSNGAGYAVTDKAANYTAANVNAGSGGWPGTACKSADPLFVANGASWATTDLHLQANSPNIDAGAFLFKTSASGSTTIIPLSKLTADLDASRVFRPGDTIQIEGSGQYVVASVTNTQIVLTAAATFQSGKGVWFPYSGTAPDIGAYEYAGSGGGDATPPGAPTNLSATAASSTTINLSWSAATDNVAVTGYKLDVSLNSAFSSFVTGYNNKDLGNVTSAAITGLSASTAYYARLRAYDAAGNVSPSKSANITITPPANSATYYASPSGSGTTCSAASPCAIAGGWAKLMPGDTLILKDGTYSNASPPSGKSGTAGNYITVKAENDGRAVLTGGIILANNSYLEFQGLKITSSYYSLDAHSSGAGLVTHHVTFKRCGFNTSTTAESGGISIYDGTNHMLFEDFWVWGGGRYSVALYGGNGGNPPNTTADFNTFRRGVIRQGPADSSPGNPEAGLAAYYASNNVIENVIVLDGNQNSDSSNAAFYLTAHAPVPGTTGSNGNKYYGCVALNNTGTGLYVDVDNGGHGDNNELHDSVIWNNANGIQLYASNGSGNLIDHCTVGVTSQYETLWNGLANTTATNSIFTRAKTYGIRNAGAFTAQHHNDLYNNASGNYNGTSAGAGSLTSNPNLLYPVRIEAGSPNKNSGSVGDIGANALKQYVNGVQTTTNLWPWPYENRIRQDMCADAGVNTGFCGATSRDGSPQTLTKYIWEYLGNQIPADIYGSSPPPTGHTYYVRPDGHDTTSGANNTNNATTGAWLTLQRAADAVAAGDTVSVADGNYAGFMLRTGGTASQRITFKAMGAGANITARNPTTNDGINIESYSSALPDYVTIDGFNVSGQARMGIRAIGGAGIVVQNCVVRDNSDCGIFSGDTPSIQVLNNTTYGNGTTSTQHNIYISNALSDNPIIRGNTVYSARGGNGIQLNGDFQMGGDGFIDNALIENNVVYGNSKKGLSLISVRYGRIQNNIIYSNGSSAGGIHIVDQLGSNYSINNVVVNNTIDEPSIAAVRVNAGSTGNILFNNICLGPTGIVFEGSGNYQSKNYSAASGSGIFVNHASHDYHLATGSPAIDYGLAAYQSAAAASADISGAARPQNGVLDAGAYEYLGGAPPPDSTPPSVPGNLQLTAASASQLHLSWTAATDNVAVAGYRLDVSPNSAFSSFATGYQNKDLGNVTSAAITGLSASTAYYARLRAYDAAGNTSSNSAFASARTSALPDTLAPTAAIISPADGANVSGTVSVVASASDNTGVSQLEFYIDGLLKSTLTSTPYVYSLETSALPLGSHAIMAKAYDAAGNSGQRSISVNVVSSSGSKAPPGQAKSKKHFLSPSSTGVVFGSEAVKVEIFNMRGRKVFDSTSAGNAPIAWTGRESGKMVESGAYMARITDSSGAKQHQTIVVVK